MATNAATIIEEAKAIFPDDVVEALERSGMAEYELESLTRDDVNNEFKHFKFGVRKALYLFLKRKVMSEGDTSTSGEMTGCCDSDTLDISSSSAGTEPSLETDEYLARDTKPSRQSKLFNKFRHPPKRCIPSSKLLEEYPGGIPSPFPLSPVLQSFLRSSRDVFTDNRAVFQVVRDVCRVLDLNLGRRPFKDEIIATSKRLCQEYPVLQCGDGECHGAVFEALRKRLSNMESSKTQRADWVRKKVRESKKSKRADWVRKAVNDSKRSEAPDAASAKRIIRNIHSMPGEGIAQRVLTEFPYLEKSEKCLEIFAVLQGKSPGQLIRDAEQSWSKLAIKFGVKVMRFNPLSTGSYWLSSVLLRSHSDMWHSVECNALLRKGLMQNSHIWLYRKASRMLLKLGSWSTI